MTASKIPNVQMCAVCSGTILAGTGLFVVVEGGVRHVHAGACAVKQGAFPGGSAAVWGERAALASAMIATDGITEVEAAEKVRWRDAEGGFAVIEFLEAMILLLGVAVVGLAIAGGRF